MPLKVCILGDSVAKGVVLDDTRGRYIYAKESAARLFEQDAGAKVDNLASFGCTVTKGEEMLKKCEDRIGEYDYTVLEFGGNDCDFDWKSVSDDPEAAHICKTPLEAFKQKYARMLETIKRLGGKPDRTESAADRFGTLFPLDQPQPVAVAHPALSERSRLHRPLAGNVQHRGCSGGVRRRRSGA